MVDYLDRGLVGKTIVVLDLSIVHERRSQLTQPVRQWQALFHSLETGGSASRGQYPQVHTRLREQYALRLRTSCCVDVRRSVIKNRLVLQGSCAFPGLLMVNICLYFVRLDARSS
jgi:hypothetical protein